MVNASEVSQDELARYYEALGPIRNLVLDDSLTEVMVNGHENVYVERNGKILLTDRKFDDENHLLRVIDFIVSRSVGASTSARRWSMPGCSTARASTPSSRRSRS